MDKQFVDDSLSNISTCTTGSSTGTKDIQRCQTEEMEGERQSLWMCKGKEEADSKGEKARQVMEGKDGKVREEGEGGR